MSRSEDQPPASLRALAATEITDAICEGLRTERGIHAETAIASAARLAGTFVFRSFGFPDDGAPPGGTVLSDAANEHGPALLQTLMDGLEGLGIGVDAAAMIGGIPEDNQPHSSLQETQRTLEPEVVRIASAHGLDHVQAAHACALATAQLVHLACLALDPGIGFAVASAGFVEGSKTMPIPRVTEAPDH